MHLPGERYGMGPPLGTREWSSYVNALIGRG
jgi:hypothetical protein